MLIIEVKHVHVFSLTSIKLDNCPDVGSGLMVLRLAGSILRWTLLIAAVGFLSTTTGYSTAGTTGSMALLTS